MFSLRAASLPSALVLVFAAALASPPALAAPGHGGSGGHGGGGHVKLTNPGAQASSVGQPVSLQIQATDSNGGALEYSATGLPSNLGIDASTGRISGTPPASTTPPDGAGQTSVTVTVTDSAGSSSASTTFTWTVNAAYDVSWPQCGGALAPAGAVSIVGVNGGIVYSENSCLDTEAAWGSGHGLELYANTANPGPAYSSHWPGGQLSPDGCSTSDLNSTACSYDYGYNAALDSFADASSVLGSAGAASSLPWWLDVETDNSWETLESAYGQTATSRANDISALEGEVSGLQSQGVSSIGFYSTSYQWGQITGGTGSTFSSDAAWLAGYSSLVNAASGCGAASFTGGPVALTQYPSGSFDADYVCRVP